MPKNVPTSAAPIRSTENFRRLADAAHGRDNAQNRRDDTEGGQAVAKRRHGIDDRMFFAVMGFEILVHEVLDHMRDFRCPW